VTEQWVHGATSSYLRTPRGEYNVTQRRLDDPWDVVIEPGHVALTFIDRMEAVRFCNRIDEHRSRGE
jgi:hypothetical protein